MDSRVVDRGEFERHFQTLTGKVVEVIADHFVQERFTFDRIQFAQAAASELDGLIRAALFDGAQIFPVEKA